MRFAGTALATLFALCGALTAESQTESKPSKDLGENKELSRATEKTSTLKSYTFDMVIEIEGAPMPMDPFEFEGKSSGEITFISGSLMGQEIEMYKKGETIVGLNPDGEWESASEDEMGPGASANMMKAPHEELEKMAEKLDDIKKAKSREDIKGTSCSIYTGTLDTENAKELLGNNTMAMMDADISGSVKLWVNDDSLIMKIEINVDIAMDFQGNQMEMTIVRTTTLSKLNETKLDIPEEVQAIIKEEEGDSSKKDSKEDY